MSPSADLMNVAEFVKNGFLFHCDGWDKASNRAMSVSLSLFNRFPKLRCIMIHNSS